MPYIAAWADRDRTIWYEFVSRGALKLLGCAAPDAAETFRRRIVERHAFQMLERLGEEVLDGANVVRCKDALREEAKGCGVVDAVYKMAAAGGGTYWLKDLATIRTFEADGISVSLGNLLVVTKEMEADEQLKKAQTALRDSEKKFREQAVRDNLTGLYNTRYLYRALSDLFVDSASSGQPISLIFMDVDNFKLVVDAHGHLNASRTLREVAHTIQAAIREPAFAVAYGGDEFVVVLPNTVKQGAMAAARAIRERIGKAVYLARFGLNIRIRVSQGVATFPDDASGPTELLALADRAMFSVKHSGKNAVAGLTGEN
jgi:diguanylate cyclase (GGDEF)-like protein